MSDSYGRADDAASGGEIIIGKYPYEAVGVVKPQNLARFQSKITTGEYSWDSDPLVSAYSMASFSGGMGNLILKEGIDDDTYWTARMETRYPHQLTNLPRSDAWGAEIGASAARGIGDYPASAPMFHAAFDAALYRWDAVDQAFDLLATMPAAPAGNGKGVDYAGKLFIPLGLSGLATWDGTTLDSSTHGAIEALGLTIYDNKLAAITTGGYLRIMGPDETWEPITDQLKLPSGAVPTGILTFLDQNQQQAIHVITTQGVWSYDRNTVTLMRTHLQYPRHPQQGRASTVFRGDAMYVAVGIGIHGYNGNTITAMGPDGRYGLPAHLRGVITDLEQEYNGLLALVQGQAVGVVEPDPPQIDLQAPHWREGDPTFSGGATTEAASTLLRWNQQGWHPAWESEGAGGTPTNVLVSSADGDYALWWGFDGTMYRQALPITFHNPKVGMQVGTDRFAPLGSLTTGWFDADMQAFTKLASHIELVIDDVFEDGTSCGEVTIRYQTDHGSPWKTLRTVSGVGRFVMPFGRVEREDGSTFSAGVPFRRIRFRIESRSRSDTVTPLIENILFKFIKIPISQYSWVVSVKLDNANGYKGISNEELRDYLVGLASADTFTRFVHRGNEYRVRVAQTNGADETGDDDRSTLTVNLVEVLLPPDEASTSDGYVSHTRVG